MKRMNRMKRMKRMNRMQPTKRAFAFALSLLLTLSPLPLSAEGETPSRSLSDYTGEGSVLAIVSAGFDVTHPVFARAPESPAIRRAMVGVTLGPAYREAYVSEKIPFAWDYAGSGFEREGFKGDADVTGLSDTGTGLASLAAGHYRGRGDLPQEDGTVLRDSDYLGAAPEAQLLLMKAAYDHSSKILGDVAAEAIRHALSLSADAVLIDLSGVTVTEGFLAALRLCESHGVPVFTGAGDTPLAVAEYLAAAPAVLTDRGTLTAAAELPAVIAVGAARDPFAGIRSLFFGEKEIDYTDSSKDYLGKSFAEILFGKEYNLIPIPGEGRPEDVAGLPLPGAVALVKRGGIPFAEKAKNAAALGAVGLIVVNNEPGTSGMVLTDSPIPAVMVTEEAGTALFADPGRSTVTIPQPEEGPADFSAAGLSENFTHTVSLLALGQEVSVAARGGVYAVRSGTVYAAASALGGYGRVLHYLRDAGLPAALGVSVLFAAAVPLTEEGAALSPRLQGAGQLSKDATVPLLLSAGQAVTVATGRKNTVRTRLRLLNPTEKTVEAAAVVAFFGEEVDGEGNLTGKRVPLSGVSVLFDGEDLTEMSAAPVTLAPGETRDVPLTVTFTEEAFAALSETFPYGFFFEGTVTLSPLAGGTPLSCPVTAFFGERDRAPLVDPTVFDEASPLLAPATLFLSSESEGFALPVGAKDPFAAEPSYGEDYVIVDPAALRNGTFSLRVTPLRSVEETTVRFYDGAGHLLFEEERGALPRYLLAGGQISLRLWDFVARDGSGYLFPDGTYRCEVTFASGESRQTLSFTVHADRTAPVALMETFHTTEKGDVLLTVKAQDNAALREIAVYDLSRKYLPTEEVSLSGEKTGEITFDLSLCTFSSPLYIEITDYAGRFTTLRYTGDEILRLLAGESP